RFGRPRVAGWTAVRARGARKSRTAAAIAAAIEARRDQVSRIAGLREGWLLYYRASTHGAAPGFSRRQLQPSIPRIRSAAAIAASASATGIFLPLCARTSLMNA